jgi:ABC-type transport system substrate-binding protein
MRLGITFGIAALVTITGTATAVAQTAAPPPLPPGTTPPVAPLSGQPQRVQGPATYSSDPTKGRAELDENGNTPGSNAAARARPVDRDAVFSRRIKGVPEDIQNLADGMFGSAASQQGAKAQWIAQQMAERWKQESQERIWKGLGADAAQTIKRGR